MHVKLFCNFPKRNLIRYLTIQLLGCRNESCFEVLHFAFDSNNTFWSWSFDHCILVLKFQILNITFWSWGFNFLTSHSSHEVFNFKHCTLIFKFQASHFGFQHSCMDFGLEILSKCSRFTILNTHYSPEVLSFQHALSS